MHQPLTSCSNMQRELNLSVWAGSKTRHIFCCAWLLPCATCRLAVSHGPFYYCQVTLAFYVMKPVTTITFLCFLLFFSFLNCLKINCLAWNIYEPFNLGFRLIDLFVLLFLSYSYHLKFISKGKKTLSIKPKSRLASKTTFVKTHSWSEANLEAQRLAGAGLLADPSSASVCALPRHLSITSCSVHPVRLFILRHPQTSFCNY